ncbi:uncharacterized protein MONOS_1695 [Monocercomonoides exilis]|uniref:uncharacterized protein n=1 Tax=Monocercomonoides exilis TaxID=2049356 RepID=UPI00355A021A|nr:hypothetical protein MONOS_1695 [Monocercomonoides exilis]|eukprot:MONOS_1695.1-p1 / transcript=MONOS_1695.1 / gene=MONOS_1695 / organism=Monocercomonoides_exilis_PA203 / gene_product=unspecified product / transcript_product=unspecified product / location=Mono_scaffold00031:118008-120662(-) / protein_length=722 / sequence_SO=supercontig / SO=protein_coding / is_pseudo=false
MSTLLEGSASGLSGIFPQSGPTGGMGAQIPISNPTSAASARTHAHSRSRSWFSDALDEGAWKVESRLLPALKAIVLATQNAKQEDKPYLSDALTFLIAALQDARHMRIIAKFGFAAARERRRPHPSLRTRVGENWSGRSDCGRYSTDLERKGCEGKTREGEWTMQRLYRREERGTSLCGVDTRGVEDGSVDQADRGPGWLPEQYFLYPEEEREIQTNPRLQTAELRAEGCSLQNGRSSHGGETAAKGRLGDFFGPFSGVFPHTCTQRVHTSPGFPVQKRFLRFQGNAVWIQGRPQGLFQVDAQRNDTGKETVEREMCNLFGRYSSSSSGQELSKSSNEGDCRLVGAVRLLGKYGEKRATTKRTLQLPWMEMGQRTDDSETRGSTTQGAETTMWKMDEVGEAQQDCESAGFSILHRATQRYALRVQRCKLVHEPMVCGSQERRERVGLEWGGASQRQSDEATGAMVTETEYEVQQEACGFCQPGSCSYNGRISLCSGSNLVYCGECPTFPQTSQPNIQRTNIELQRALGLVFNINRWGAGPNLISPLRKIQYVCQALDLTVKAIHIPGDKNVIADSLSRLAIAGDYEIRTQNLREAEAVLEAVPNVDAFANIRNKKRPIWYGPGSPWCTDGLAADWREGVILAHPPVPLIMPCLKKAQTERARVVLFLPAWKNQVWSQILEEMETHRVMWKDAKEVLIPGEGLRRTGASLPPGGYMAARLNW